MDFDDFEVEGWEDRWVPEAPWLDGTHKDNDIQVVDEDDPMKAPPLPGEEEA